jgi:hypothetical protein
MCDRILLFGDSSDDPAMTSSTISSKGSKWRCSEINSCVSRAKLISTSYSWWEAREWRTIMNDQ